MSETASKPMTRHDRWMRAERIRYWTIRGLPVKEAERIADTPAGTCAGCGGDARAKTSRWCVYCSQEVRKRCNTMERDEEALIQDRLEARYRHYRRLGFSQEEARSRAESMLERGICHRPGCGKPAYSPNAITCEDCVKASDRERQANFQANKRKEMKDRKCKVCGVIFQALSAELCPKHRYRHTSAKRTRAKATESQRIAIEPRALPKVRKQEPAVEENPEPIVFTVLKPPPPVSPPPGVEIQKLPPVGLAARSFRDYFHDAD